MTDLTVIRTDAKVVFVPVPPVGAPGAPGPPGSGSTIGVKDHGSLLATTFQRVNFTGAGVTVNAPSGTDVDVDIPGGGAGDDIAADSLGAAFDNSTDDHVNIISTFTASKALAGNGAGGGYYKGGPSVVLPSGKTGYMAANAISIFHTMLIEGKGAGRHSPLARGASSLRFAAGTNGLNIEGPNTSDSTTVDATHDGSGGVGIRSIMFQGPENGVEAVTDASSGTTLLASDIGICGRKQVTGYDIYVRGFKSIGIAAFAGTVRGTNYSGDVSLSAYYAVKVENCQVNWFFAGSDANITLQINCEGYTGTQFGFYWDLGIGPAIGIGLHAAGNGLISGYLNYMCHLSGHRYQARFGKTITELTTNSPSGTSASNAYWRHVEAGGPDSTCLTWDGVQQFRVGADYCTAGPDNPNQVAGLICIYSENPGCSLFGGSTLLFNADIAAKYRDGGVHIYAVGHALLCDENVHFGANLMVDGATHTFGNNAGPLGSTTVNFDSGGAGSDVGIYFRGPGGTMWGYADYIASGVFMLAGSASGYNFRCGTVGSNTTPLVVDQSGIYPGADNSVSCGKSGHRWTELFAATATVNTSDKRLKTAIASIDDEILDAWADVGWQQFQFKAAVKAKGKDGARVHIGIVAQRVEEVFKSHGLDGFRLGLLCFDKWDDEFEQDFETKTIMEEVKIAVAPKHEGTTWVRRDNDVRAAKRKGKPGKWIRRHNLSEEQRRGWRMEKRQVEVQVPKFDDKGDPVMRLRLKAGEVFGVRYEEALALEAALQRRERTRLEERIIAIEKRLAA